MSTLQSLGTKISAAAAKLEMDGEKILGYLHQEVDRLLGLADEDVAAAKADIQGVEVKAEKVEDHVETKVEGEVQTGAAQAVSLLDKMKGAVGLA